MKPSSPYSASKAAADLLVLSYCRTYNINGVVTRSCNNYGPYQYKEKLIPVIITNLLKNKKIPIYGTGQNIREWIHVRDNCEGIMAALKLGEPGGIYHMGSGIELTNLDITKQILAIMNKPESLISMVKDRKGHDFRYSLDSKETHSQLNWKPKTNLESGLKETVEFYKKIKRDKGREVNV
jgi:dTDP-glucose 4,6-dehydratase